MAGLDKRAVGVGGSYFAFLKDAFVYRRGLALAFGLGAGCGAMASAKSVGENFAWLQCGGDFSTTLYH